MTSPTLITGSPANGTYKCIAFEMDDTFTLVPDAPAAASLPLYYKEGVASYQDIYRTNTPVADKVFIIASTSPSAVTARGYSDNQTVTLTNPMVVPGQVTFSLDLANHIETSNNRCGMAQIPMSFE